MSMVPEYYSCDWQDFGGRFYSQRGEDIIVLNIFQHMKIDKPSYLDLGAHHPYHINNTQLFYMRGSRGINVEPNPNLIEAFHTHRSGDTNLCVGVGPERGELDFYMSDPMSGRNSFMRELALEGVTEVSKIQVPVVLVSDIIRDYAGGVFPDFLSVDIEGFDYAVLKSIDYQLIRGPRVICVEMFSGLKGQMDNTKEIKRCLNPCYFFHSQVGANGIFVHRNYKWELGL